MRAARSTTDESTASRAGYTLTEMLVVVAIIGLISAVVIPQTIGQMGKAQSRTAKLEMQTVATALEIFSGDTGRYPTEAEGLQALLKEPDAAPGWSGPYLKGIEQITDPWGVTYRYAPEGPEGFTLQCLGADKAPGGTGAARDLTI